MAKTKCDEIVNTAMSRGLTCDDLLRIAENAVCIHYDLTSEALRSKSRFRPVPEAKNMFYMLALGLSKYNYGKISKMMGRTHCMVVIANRYLIDLDCPWNSVVKSDYHTLLDMISKVVSCLPQVNSTLVDRIIAMIEKDQVAKADENVVNMIRILQGINLNEITGDQAVAV